MERVSHTVSHQKKSHAKPKLALPQCTQNKVIEQPSVHDVLFGRGGRINQHEGNISFRNLIHQQQGAYNLKANSKEVKANISRDIVEQIKLGKGRFLERQNVSTSSKSQWSKWWVEVDDSRAMSKTSQALREGAPSLRAQEVMASREQKRKVVRTNGTKSSKRARKSRKIVCKDITNSKVQTYFEDRNPVTNSKMQTHLEDRNPATDDSTNDSLLRMDLLTPPSSHTFELPVINYHDEGEVLFNPEMFSHQVHDLDSYMPCAVSRKTPTTPALERENSFHKKTCTDKENHNLDSLFLNEADDDIELTDKNDFSAFPVLFTENEYQETDIVLLVDVLLMQAVE